MNKKFLELVRFIRYSVIVLLMVVMAAFMIYAQPNANNSNARVDRGSNDRTVETRTVERDDGFDWGWLGLLGLLGLAGLIPKSRKVEVQEFRDTNRPTTGGTATH